MALVGDDCYFYYTSGCVRGMQCAFRHQPAAKNTEIVCPDWLGGACFKQTCFMRHMLMPNARVQIQCRWDTMPSGCLDAGCTYAHVNKNIIIPGASTIEVKSSSSSIVRQPLLSSPLARTGVLKFSNDIPSLPSNSSISQMINGMPHANIVEALPAQILNAPGVINVAPPLIPLQQPLILNVPRPHLHSSILGPPPVLANSSVFPRNDFQQQVQLFKDLLAQKNKTCDIDDFENGRRDKHKEKFRYKKERKNVRKFSKDSKKKIKLSKVEEEILFGDYKDIPLDKRKKKEQSEAMPNINIKSYEEILREKVFKKTMEKRREFVEDFKELTSEEKNKNNKILERQNIKKSTKMTSNSNVSLNDNEISKDYVDINISIDENDELVKELNEASRQKSLALNKNSGRNKVANVSSNKDSLMNEGVNKRKIIRLDKDEKTPLSNIKEPTPKSDIKIKTFEEIMLEKRKRKIISSEPEIVSEPDMIKVKRILDPLHIKSVKAKTELRRNNAVVKDIKDMDSKKDTKDVFKVRSNLGLTSISNKNMESNSKDCNAGTVVKKIITIAKPDGKNSEDKSIVIRSFDEIMREKQLRKQNEKSTQADQASNDVKPTEKVDLNQTSKPTEKVILMPSSKSIEKVEAMPTSKPLKKVVLMSTVKSVEKVASMTNKPTEKVNPMPTSKPTEKVTSMTISKSSDKVTSLNGHNQLPLSDNDKVNHVKSNTSSQIKKFTEKNSSTLEHIKEALDEVKRKRDEYLLSDEEFEKEINDLSSNEGEDCINDDLDDDDLIIELSEMIDGN